MERGKIKSVIDRIYKTDNPAKADLEFLLKLEADEDIQVLFDYADSVRREFVGDSVLIRGIVEFSSYCRNTCLYCGLNKFNKKLKRYRLSDEEILQAVDRIYQAGVKTVVLQSGEEDDLDAKAFARVIEQIKLKYDIAVTLSVGERTRDEYELWKAAGADRYLLKIETCDRELYNKFHPEMSFDNRLRCLDYLEQLGYQTGCGNLVGLKGQDCRILA